MQEVKRFPSTNFWYVNVRTYFEVQSTDASSNEQKSSSIDKLNL